MAERTYVFDNGGDGCNNSGLMGLIGSLCNRQGIDPAYLYGLMNNGNNGFGNSAWWIIILLIFGWGGFGGGFGGFGGRGNGQGLADLGNLVNNDAGRELLQQAILNNGQAISQLANTLGCDYNALNGAIQNLSTQLCTIGGQIGLGQKDIVAAIQNGNQAILSKLCDCCCQTQRQIADFRGDIALQMCQQTNTLSNGQRDLGVAVTKGFCDTAYATREQTCELKNDITALKTFLAEKFSQQEFREMQRENQSLRDRLAKCELSDSQRAQTREIIDTVRPCPTPAFITCNPWAAGNYYGYGYNNGCCGNNNCGSCGCGN